jgi:hypothetical protein
MPHNGIRTLARPKPDPDGNARSLLELYRLHPDKIQALKLVEMGCDTDNEEEMIIVMTTGEHINDGREQLRQSNKEAEGGGGWLHFDTVARKCRHPAWKCFGLHTYSLKQRRIITILTAYLKKETTVAFSQIWKVRHVL